MPPSLLVFGAESLVGSDFVVRATERFTITAAGPTDPRSSGWPVRRFQPLDPSDEPALRAFLASRSEDEAWVNFLSRGDPDACESERPPVTFDAAEVDRPDSAWRWHAALPGWLSEEAARKGIPLLHVSSDRVFDGRAGPYAEGAEPSPLTPDVSWAGYTMGVGEARLRSGGAKCAIVRVSHPYRTAFPPGTDFARDLLDRGQTRRLGPLYDDQIVTPTWIPDVTACLLAILGSRATGVFHVASPEPTTPLAFAEELFRVFRVETGPLTAAKLSEEPPPPGRAPEPLHGGLQVRRLAELGITPTGFREGILQMATAQESPH